MKKIYVFLLLLCGCHGVVVPDAFTYREIETGSYQLASWQKITDPEGVVRIYIEGDGYAFDHHGQPTDNPTPRGTFFREIAFHDPNPNVVYLARPCQYVTDGLCTPKDWTTGRFSQNIVTATARAIQKIAPTQKIILIGYSGGALLSGLVINQNPQLPVIKWVTIAGLLNHTLWTQELNLPPLTSSVDLKQVPTVAQRHFIGDKDSVIPCQLTQKLVNGSDLVVVPDATHNSGFEAFYGEIY